MSVAEGVAVQLLRRRDQVRLMPVWVAASVTVALVQPVVMSVLEVERAAIHSELTVPAVSTAMEEKAWEPLVPVTMSP